MIGNRLNKYISGCHILCLRWLRTNVHAKCIDEYSWADPEGGGGRGGGSGAGGPDPPPPEKSQEI